MCTCTRTYFENKGKKLFHEPFKYAAMLLIILCAMHKICPAGLLANQQAIDCVHFVQTLDKKHFSFCSSLSNKYVYISVHVR